MRLHAGANWNNGTNSGSLSRNANNAGVNRNANNAARGVIPWYLVFPNPKGQVARADSFTSRVSGNTNQGWQGASRNTERTEPEKRMKRHGNLWEQFISKENFQIALNNAIRGKKNRDYVKKFMMDPENNLERIRQDMIHKRFHTAKYTEKEIYEPKKRIIYMLPFVPDRIVQHALMRILIPILEKLFITDTYASIDGRGMHKGSKRVMQFIANNDYFLKCDIRKFYPSVDHDILMDIVRHKIKDKNILWLIEDIVRSFPGDKNLPIGNYFSQWGGNWYLNELDYYVKNKLKCKCYLRYCDDFCLFSNDKKQLAEWREKIRIFLAERLKLIYSKAEISHIKNGVDFLGYRHFRRNGKRYILVRKRTAKRMIKHIRKTKRGYNKGFIPVEQALSRVGSYYGWVKYANSHHLKISTRIDGFMRYLKNEQDSKKIQ